MAFPNKTALPVAQSNRTEINLDSQHITTSNFMQFDLAKFLDLVPNQSINYKHETFARLEPLAMPTFGLAKIQNKSFFVPYRTVFPAFNDFITDCPHTYSNGHRSLVSRVPVINNSKFTLVFTQNAFSSVVTSGSSYDFVYVDSDGRSAKRKFTMLGRKFFKLLSTLGYGILFNDSSQEDYQHSALPLLCVAKVYCDWYFPSQYTDNTVFSRVEALFKYDVNNVVDLINDVSRITDIANLINVVSYDIDYFTSAWDKPGGPNQGLSSSYSFNDINNANITATQAAIRSYPGTTGMSANSPVINGGLADASSASPITSLSQYALDSLKALTDYLKRHQIAAGRSIDRYLASYGVELQSDKLQRSLFISESSQDIQFGDVMSTADTDGAELGSYAGKGISYGDGYTDFDTVEHGMFITISVIMPKTAYYQGISRNTRHITRLDFFTGEFDALGVQAMMAQEVYNPTDGVMVEAYGDNYSEKVFGFVPRYAEYKTSFNRVTGDYVLGSMNVGKEAWTLFRDVTPEELDDVVHSPDFIQSGDSAQYHRIFTNTSPDVDKFNIIHNFNITSSFPGKSLFDTYEFENEDKARKVSVNINGTTMN